MNILDFIQTPNWCMKLKKPKESYLRILKQTLIMQTPFLPDDVKLQQRAWHLLNNVNSIPECPVCKSHVPFQKENVYSKYCSKKCASESSERSEKIQKSNIARYGSEEAYKKASADRLKKSAMEKYGVQNYFQAKEVKNKIKETMLETYGVEHPAYSTEIKNKRGDTMEEKYGVRHALQSEKIMEKFTATVNERFGVDHVLQSPEVIKKMQQKYSQKYGVKHHTQINIGEDALDKLNDSKWLTQQHHNHKQTLSSIANDLKINGRTIARYMHKNNVDIKRFANSQPEREIAEFLTDNNYTVITNTRDIITPLELDIYLPDHKLAIEYCGLYWHSEFSKPKLYHYEKYQKCKDNGIRLLTIFENEWLNSKQLVLDKILYITGQTVSDKIYAKNTEIVQLSTKDKKQFLHDNHIQGDGMSSINFGLKYDNKIVACIAFLKQENSYILNRYATSCQVVGGFSKLLKHFETVYNNPEIITFADLRWSEGELYQKTGFNIDSILKPDYAWTRDKQLWHKFLWRHTSGMKHLENYDPKKSETENMHAHGFAKIWDCGKIKYIKNKKDA